ncbi:MAG: hypothetical protein WA944_00555 [Mycobacterium sp.]
MSCRWLVCPGAAASPLTVITNVPSSSTSRSLRDKIVDVVPAVPSSTLKVTSAGMPSYRRPVINFNQRHRQRLGSRHGDLLAFDLLRCTQRADLIAQCSVGDVHGGVRLCGRGGRLGAGLFVVAAKARSTGGASGAGGVSGAGGAAASTTCTSTTWPAVDASSSSWPGELDSAAVSAAESPSVSSVSSSGSLSPEVSAPVSVSALVSVRVFRAEALSAVFESAADEPVVESADELEEDELEDDDDDDPDDESSLSACAVGMASAAPTPRKTASAPTRPMNFPRPAAPLDLPGRPSASKFGERITTSPQDVS